MWMSRGYQPFTFLHVDHKHTVCSRFVDTARMTRASATNKTVSSYKAQLRRHTTRRKEHGDKRKGACVHKECDRLLLKSVPPGFNSEHILLSARQINVRWRALAAARSTRILRLTLAHHQWGTSSTMQDSPAMKGQSGRFVTSRRIADMKTLKP